MHFESIVPGALPSPKDAAELHYNRLSAKRLGEIPPTGGVGKIPLIIHHQHKLPSCTGEAGATLRKH